MFRPRIRPQRWTPLAPPRTTPTRVDDRLTVLPVPGHGTEDVLVLDGGRVLTGLVDGRIVSVDPAGGQVDVVADTGGRPLGLELHPDGGVVVCDARRGLLRVDLATGDVRVLATGTPGRPFVFCNNAAVAADGTVYVSDSSDHLGIDHWRGELLEHRPSGRVCRVAPDGAVDVVADGLAFANGLALLADESALVVAETSAYALRRIRLADGVASRPEPFGPPLPGFPDNISTGDDGLVWVALASPRDRTLDTVLPHLPALRRAVWAAPERLQPNPQRVVHVQAYDAAGRLVHDLAGTHPGFGMPTGVRRHDDAVWLGSLEESAIARIDLPRASAAPGA